MATAPVERLTVESKGVFKSGIAANSVDKDPVLPIQVPAMVPAQFVDPAALAPARPLKVLFAGLHDLNLRFAKPVPLDVSVEESHVVVAWSEIDEYGAGETLGAALDDFGTALRSLYYQLMASDQLGPDLGNVKQLLSEYITVRQR